MLKIIFYLTIAFITHAVLLIFYSIGSEVNKGNATIEGYVMDIVGTILEETNGKVDKITLMFVTMLCLIPAIATFLVFKITRFIYEWVTKGDDLDK